ncbi:hypothetical protein GCM10027341_20890 [Spirosoma knui]
MKYLVDVNLPKKFRFFNTADFTFVVDIKATLPDTEIWTYALETDFVILTKDADFYIRALTAERRPKIIRFKLGNQTLSDLHQYFSDYLFLLTDLIRAHSLLVAYPDRVDIIFKGKATVQYGGLFVYTNILLPLRITFICRKQNQLVGLGNVLLNKSLR